MTHNERYTDKLAKYILIAATTCLIGLICWYFKSVLLYIIIAAVVSLVAKPLMGLMQKVQIKGKRLPDWILAAFSLAIVIGLLIGFACLVVPIISGIVKNISLESVEASLRSIAGPLADLNAFLSQSFPRLGEDFRIETAIAEEIQKMFDVSVFSSWIGSAASYMTNLAVGLFSVAFIGFFFIKDDGTFTNIICALVPDKHEETTEQAISDIGYLLSRYFIGVFIEVLGVAIINLSLIHI